MEQRTRTRSRTTVGGTVSYPGSGGSTVGGPQVSQFHWSNTVDYWRKKRRYFDLTGSGLPPSDFTSDQIERKWSPLNGGANDVVFWFHNWDPDGVVNNSASHGSFPFGKDKGNDAYVLKLLKRTNPLGPIYSVPVAIRELVDLTTLFRLAAGTIAGFFGNAYLSYRFGWLSLLQDIRTLEGLVKSVNSRIRSLNSLRQRGGLRRKVDLDAFGIGGGGDKIISSVYGVTITCRETWTTHRKVWGSVRWYPRGGDGSLFPTEPADQWLLAVRQVLDLESIDARTAWELIPWSWLIDYFTDIGDFFAAYEGRELIEPTDICIMRETTTYNLGVRKPSGNLGDRVSGGGYMVTHTTKERKVITTLPAFPQVFSNLLSVSELKIVIALLAKFRG